MLEKRHAGRLPHWRLAGGAYFVTFRLADSLPQSALHAYEQEFADEVRRKELAFGRSLTGPELYDCKKRWLGRVDRLLDTGVGECVLKVPGCAEILREVMEYPSAHKIYAWAIMPNHTHAVLRPHPGTDLSNLLQVWKGASAHRINSILGRKGRLWQKESFDHLVRHSGSLEKFIGYTLENPVKAGLKDWPFASRTEYELDDISWPVF